MKSRTISVLLVCTSLFLGCATGKKQCTNKIDVQQATSELPPEEPLPAPLPESHRILMSADSIINLVWSDRESPTNKEKQILVDSMTALKNGMAAIVIEFNDTRLDTIKILNNSLLKLFDEFKR
jgi:hypothetical protein